MGKLTRISLADVPLSQRMAAARRLAQECSTDLERAELMAAALIPSKRVLFLPAAAVAAVLPEHRAAA